LVEGGRDEGSVWGAGATAGRRAMAGFRDAREARAGRGPRLCQGWRRQRSVFGHAGSGGRLRVGAGMPVVGPEVLDPADGSQCILCATAIVSEWPGARVLYWHLRSSGPSPCGGSGAISSGPGGREPCRGSTLPRSKGFSHRRAVILWSRGLAFATPSGWGEPRSIERSCARSRWMQPMPRADALMYVERPRSFCRL
jgi:hypothetical protein